MEWNLGDVFDFLGKERSSDSVAVRQGTRDLTWGQLDERSNNLARALRDSGLKTGDKVAVFGRNSAEYIISLIAAFKARLVYVNVNYRYREDELFYIFDYTDAAAIIFDSAFANEVAKLEPRLTKVRVLVENEAPGGEIQLKGAHSFRKLSETGTGQALTIERSPDDKVFICTGGTTGMPKAVMWRQHDTFTISASPQSLQKNAPETWDELRDIMDHQDGNASLISAPLMHGMGMYVALTALIFGARVILTPHQRFDAKALLEIVKQEKVATLPLIGDAFGRPVLAALDANPDLTLETVRFIVSSAAAMSLDVKRGLLQHGPPGMTIVDAFGASETASYGSSRMTLESIDGPPKIKIGPHTKVFTEDLREVVPGSGEAGFVARGGTVPIGYYKHPEKSEAAFREINGERYSIPGDWCEIEQDGTLKFLGRGNVSINTGGEKVYPQEVEEALLAFDAVHDVVVVGVPDDRWGERVTAVVEVAPGASMDAAAIRAELRHRLADYKIPKQLIEIDTIGRGPNGKADYPRMAQYAQAALLDA